MEYHCEGGRGSFVLRVFRCVIFLLVAVLIYYNFLYFISRQHTSPFHTRNIATLHFQQNFSTANMSNSKISTGKKSNFCKLLGGIMHRSSVMFPFPT